MKIIFYYIKGINEVDTPSFLGHSALEIQNFFNHYKVFTLDSNTYYPPYYTNTIKLTKEDLPYSTRFNYIALVYENKYYYYFLDTVNYISDSIYSIKIHMDSFATFAQDLEIDYGIIERMHINRYVYSAGEWRINRNYIRENFSKEDYVLLHDKAYYKSGDFENDSNDLINGIIVVKRTERLLNPIPDTDKTTGSNVYYPDFYTKFQYQCCLSFIPVVNGEFRYYLSDIENATTVICDLPISRNYLASLPKTVSIYYIPYNSINTIMTSAMSGTNCHINYHSNKGLVVHDANDYDSGSHVNGKYFDAQGTHFPVTNLYDTPNDSCINFTRNATLAVPISYTFEPSLLDENYFNITFGEKECYITAPLYLFDKKEFKFYYNVDIYTGNRIYWCNGSLVPSSTNATRIGDILNTRVITNTPLFMDLLTDAYQEWYVQNRATIPLSVLRSGVRLVGSAVGAYFGGIGGAIAAGSVSGALLSSPKSYTSRGFLSAEARKGLTDVAKVNGKDITFGEVSSGLNGGINLLETYANKTLEGSYTRSSGDYSSGFISNYCYCHLRYSRVKDIEKAAMMYRKFGNKVEKVCTSINDLSSIIKTRYYYNYVKFSEISLHLYGYVNDSLIIEDLERRFIDGLRFWEYNTSTYEFYTDSGINDYKYDNVELAFI